MKTITLFLIFIFIIASANAQVTTTLNENFDVSCKGNSGPDYPPGWSEYNIIQPKNNLGWNCTPDGEGGTPGIQCYGNYNGSNYLDTAWLFTPQLDLSGYTGNVYFQFDAKYEMTLEKFAIFSTQGNIPDSIFVFSDLTDSVKPQLSINPVDSSAWTTYQVDIT
jgi:hypothetical protein